MVGKQKTKAEDPRIVECEEGMIETCVNYNFFFDSFSTRSPSHHSELYFFAECEEGVIETCVNYLCGLRLIRAIGNYDHCVGVAIFTVQWSVTMVCYNDL